MCSFLGYGPGDRGGGEGDLRLISVDFLEEIQVFLVCSRLVLLGWFDLPDLSCSVSGFLLVLSIKSCYEGGGMATDVPGQTVSFTNGN